MGCSGYAKIEKFDAVARHEDVGRLQVSMHDTVGMQRLQAAEYFIANAHGIRKREWATRETDCERLTLESLHGKEKGPVGLANLVDLTNIWMIDGGGQASFPPEPVACKRIVDRVPANGLQRDWSSETRIDCVIDETHPAFTEQVDHTK